MTEEKPTIHERTSHCLSPQKKSSSTSAWLSLLSCSLCGEMCRRAVTLSCCGPASQACRSCAVKRVTAGRTCWICQRTDLSLADDLSNFEQLREACSWFKDHEALESQQVEELEKLRKEGKVNPESRRLDRLGDKEKKICRELLKNEDKKREKLEDKVRKEKERDEKKDKISREERDARRKREKEKLKEKEREERNKRKELEKVLESQRRKAWEKRKEELAAEKILREARAKVKELELIEKTVDERIEKIISKLVEEQLEMHKKEIEGEVLRKVRTARLKMEKEIKEEILIMKKVSQEKEKKRKEDFEKYVMETEQTLEEERKKIAEERLELLADREQVEKDLRKQQKREDKKLKNEQSIILGKDKSRPKLSFSFSK